MISFTLIQYAITATQIYQLQDLTYNVGSQAQGIDLPRTKQLALEDRFNLSQGRLFAFC